MPNDEPVVTATEAADTIKPPVTYGERAIAALDELRKAIKMDAKQLSEWSQALEDPSEMYKNIFALTAILEPIGILVYYRALEKARATKGATDASAT